MYYFQDGVVSTLNRVKLPSTTFPSPNPSSPLLQPFPSLDMNKEGDCQALQNVDAIEVTLFAVQERLSRSPALFEHLYDIKKKF